MYEPEAGTLTWRISRGNNGPKAGAPAGWLKRGYAWVRVDERQLAVGRVAYALYHGVDPYPHEVDHINRNPSDNRICNLRIVTRSENCKNRHNTSAINQRQGVTITYPDGGTVTSKSVGTAAFLLGKPYQHVSRIINRGGVIHAHGITLSYHNT